MSESACIVITTVDSLEVAETLALGAVEKHLAACVQVVPNVTSYYRWQGRLEKSNEFQIQLKTLDSRIKELMQYLKAEHTYETPEIIFTRIQGMESSYEKWFKTSINEDMSQ